MQVDQTTAVRARPGGLRWHLLVQLTVAVVPAMAMLGLGAPALGARYFFGVLCLLLVVHLFARNRLAYVTLMVGGIPAAMMLREYFYFNSVVMLLLGGLLLWFAVAYDEFRETWRNWAFIAFLVAAVLYWWMSFLRMGVYSSNFRVLELAFSAASVVLLAKYRSYLATALVGIGISTVAVGLGLSPYGERLGMADFGTMSLGNPITLGLPAALILLLSVTSKGQWLLVSERPLLRIGLTMAVAACLLLSTSRGSWLVALVGLVVVFAGTRRRASLVLSLAPIAIAGMLALVSGRGAYVTQYLARAIAPERTLAQRTTGRYQQWVALPRIFAESPVWGFGPGSGFETNVRFTGSHKVWHSLYLQVAVETGMIGVVLLVGLLGSLWWSGAVYRKRTGDVIPLAGALCFMAIAVSVSGMDAISGVFLGIAFLGEDLRNVFAVRQVVITRPTAQGYTRVIPV